jgi:hypothetical protein
MEFRKISGLLLILVFVSSAAALEVSVGSSCTTEEEPMISLNDTSGGPIAEPGYYDNKVCVSQAEYFEVQENCGKDGKTVFSMKERNNSNLSIYKNEYLYKVCTQRMVSKVRNSCKSNETKALSVTSENNTQAAAPSYADSTYSKSLCIRNEIPENFTLELSGVSGPIYADGESINSGESITPPINYPYIVSDQPLGIVDYGSILRLSRPDSNTISAVQETNSGSFIIPFTTGGQKEIEGAEENIANRRFLDLVSPNFGFKKLDTPIVKVRYNFPYKANGFENELSAGRNEFSIRNKGLQQDDLRIDINHQ